MSGLFSTLANSVKALDAHSRAIEIAGRNISNVNNPNYARQRVIYGDRGTVVTPQGAMSLGLEALSVEQLRDRILDGQVLRETALRAGYEAEQRGYQQAQASLGQTVSSANSTDSVDATTTGGIAASLDDFFNSFQSLAARPTDTGERQLLLQKASILTDRLRLTDTRLAQVQSSLDDQVASDVSKVNQLLQSIAQLNGQIGSAEVNNPGSAVDLRDERQARLEDLAALMPVDVSEGSNGEIQVSSRDASNNPVVLVSAATVTGPVTVSGTTISAGSPATALNLASGSIAGAITARTGAVQDLRDNLDKLTQQLVTSVNNAYNPTGTTGNFFDPAGVTAGTIAIAAGVTATTLKASDGGAAGDNTIALAVANLAQQSFSTAGGDAIDGTFSQHFASTVSNLGQALASANSRAADESNIEQLVRSQRDSVSGVSLDEEMSDLVRFQRAYQASSRVFSIVNDLLDTVVNHLGA
ncbi:MAG TPA: flagellar hook-associated protein FlgK [Opitutus sp.]|nr:flagellar hook-associated protein FlgK [Opitutus sp.]